MAAADPADRSARGPALLAEARLTARWSPVRRRWRCWPACRSSSAPTPQDLVVKVMILAIFALSLELLVGTTGLVSLGHAAFLGIGAYADGPARAHGRPRLAAAAAGAALACAAAYAVFVGALSLRTRGVYFIMVTLAFAQMAYFVFHDTAHRRRQRRHLPQFQAGPRQRRST